MALYPSKHSQPERKLGIFDSRLERLRGAVRRGEGTHHVSKAAEHVRFAALQVIKAKRVIIGEFPARDPDGQESLRLLKQEQRWLALSIDEIVEAYGKADA